MIGMLFMCSYKECSNHGIPRVILEDVERDEEGAPVLTETGGMTPIPIAADDVRRRCEGSYTLETTVNKELTHETRQCFRPMDRMPNGIGADVEHEHAESPTPDETDLPLGTGAEITDLIAAGVAAAVQTMLPDTATAKQKSDAYDKASQAATDAVSAAQDAGSGD